MDRLACAPEGEGRGFRGRLMAAVPLAACVALALPSPGSAQQRLVFDVNGEEVELFCDSYDSCEGDEDCADVAEELGEELVCAAGLLGEPQCLFDREAKTELACCGEGGVDGCPPRLGVEGTCTEVAETDVGVCLYPELFRLCPADNAADEVTREDLVRCFQLPGQDGYTLDWKRGDCDGDGTANGLDCFPCDRDRQECPNDAGVPDAGTGEDGGRPGADAGGTGDADGGEEPASQVSFRGDGGCECRAANGGDGAGGLLVGLVLLGLALGRTRRRR
ncbi:MAG: MYXO-CTERM sorting domain-containing protein [Myxococcota bacterium]